MENMTAARDISAVAPINVLRGIKPLCVPYVPSSDFAEETQRRADPRIESLWKRLGLVYLFDQPQPAAVSRTRITVNNFTAQLVFRVCMQNHTDRLIERYQPGFVFPENIRRAAIEYTTGRSAAVRRVFDMIRENSRYTEEVSRIFRLVFEKESGGIPLQTVCRALAVLLGSTGGGAVLTSQQQVIFQRIASVLSEEYPESTAAQEIASVGAAAVFTETQRRRILEAASEMGYRSQHDAAQRVLSLVDSGRTREEIGKVLLSEISRYGLENAAPDDGQESVRILSAVQDSMQDVSAVPGRVVQDHGQEYSVAEILYAMSENTAEPGEISSVTFLENSVLRRISTAMKSAAIPGGRTESASAPVAEFRGESTSRLVQTSEERSILAQLSRLSRVSRTEIFRSIFGNDQDIIGAPIAEKALPGQANITAATAVRIISRLMKEQPGKSAIEPSPGGDMRDSGSVTRTIDILRRHSSEAGTQGSPAEINSGYYTVEQQLDLAVFPGSEQPVQGTALPAESAPVGESTNVHITEIHSGEDGETVRESAAGRVLPEESATVGDSTNVHNTEIHSGEDRETVWESAAGRVLPAESAPVGDSTNVHITEIHPGEDRETVRESVAGTVLPVESRSESTVNTHILSEETQPVKSAMGSYRSRLDRKTLEVIDRLVDSARSGTAPGITVQPGFPGPQGIELPQGSPAQSGIPVQLENPMPQELTYAEQSREIPPQTAGSDEVRNLSILRKSIVSLSSRHISRLIEKAGSTAAAERETPGKRLSYRTVDSADSMVMLIPPAEMDRFRAADPYARSMPPIELKEPSRPQESGNPGAVRSTIVNNKPVVVRSAESAVDSLSREDISRLADKVYDRIETRLSRERRRVGL